jgi:hypothetical protein
LNFYRRLSPVIPGRDPAEDSGAVRTHHPHPAFHFPAVLEIELEILDAFGFVHQTGSTFPAAGGSCRDIEYGAVYTVDLISHFGEILDTHGFKKIGIKPGHPITLGFLIIKSSGCPHSADKDKNQWVSTFCCGKWPVNVGNSRIPGGLETDDGDCRKHSGFPFSLILLPV